MHAPTPNFVSRSGREADKACAATTRGDFFTGVECWSRGGAGALDSNLAEGRVALALGLLVGDCAWDAAEHEFRPATHGCAAIMRQKQL